MIKKLTCIKAKLFITIDSMLWTALALNCENYKKIHISVVVGNAPPLPKKTKNRNKTKLKKNTKTTKKNPQKNPCPNFQMLFKVLQQIII